LRELGDTLAPPPLPPGEGRQYYLPELYYIYDTEQVPLPVVQSVTAQCVVQWADRCVAVLPDYYVDSVLAQPGTVREGTLPETLAARLTLLDELFTTAERTHPPGSLRLELKSANHYVQLQDGLLPVLVLTPGQFAAFQACLGAHGLPQDLYYPASAQQEFVEPVATHGGIVRMLQRYTPKRAELRPLEKAARARVPSERQRDRAFLAASQRYLDALRLRIARLHEPGTPDRRAEIEELERVRDSVLAHVVGIAKKYGGRP